MRCLALLGVAACLGGCDQITAITTAAPDKVNAAFPLADELQLAHNRLFASLDSDTAAQTKVRQQFDQLMNARALACSASSPVGRFDTPAAIKRKITDAQCFNTQDAQLEEWVGLRRVALAFGAPPLIPLAALPARTLLPNTPEPVSTAALAAEANVLVFRGYQQRFTALQVPTGKEISNFSVAESQGRKASLSPNGRLLAVPAGKGIRFVEVESGKVVWATDKLQEVVAWAAQPGLIVFTQSTTGTPQMLDVQSGRLEAYPAAEKRLTWSATLPGGRMLVGGQATVSLMEQTREANGTLNVRAVNQWQLPAGGMQYQSAPMVLDRGNKIVYANGNRDLAWLDLASGAQGSWQFSAVNASGFAKLGENLVAFDSTVSGTATMPTRVLDTDKQTVYAAKDLSARDGQMLSLVPRTGFVKRGPHALLLAGSLESEEPQEVERYLSDALLARQMAKIAQLEQESSLRSAQQQSYIDALSKQVRAMNTSSAIRDGLPRETVEAIRRGNRAVAGTEQYAAAGPAGAPMLQGIPADAKVSIIGVYESANGSHGHGKARTAGHITVRVAPGTTPLVLVLASYEPVNWVVQPGNRKLAAVLVSGYHASTVHGQGAALVVRIGSQYAYKIDSSEFSELRRTVARYVGPISPQFQGGYQGAQFQVQ